MLWLAFGWSMLCCIVAARLSCGLFFACLLQNWWAIDYVTGRSKVAYSSHLVQFVPTFLFLPVPLVLLVFYNPFRSSPLLEYVYGTFQYRYPRVSKFPHHENASSNFRPHQTKSCLRLFYRTSPGWRWFSRLSARFPPERNWTVKQGSSDDWRAVLWISTSPGTRWSADLCPLVSPTF